MSPAAAVFGAAHFDSLLEASFFNFDPNQDPFQTGFGWLLCKEHFQQS